MLLHCRPIAFPARGDFAAPWTASIALTESRQLTAIGQHADGSTRDVTRSATWRSMAEAIATVSSDGMLVGVGPGTTEITAAVQSVISTVPISVAPLVFKGVVVSNGNNSPLSGAVVHRDGADPVTTDKTGAFTISGDAGQDRTIRVSAAGFLTRETRLNRGLTHEPIRIDLIRMSQPFQLAFYQYLIRGDGGENAQYHGGGMQPIRRWDEQPSFYVRTIDVKTGQPIEPSFINMIRAAIIRVVPQTNGGRFGALAVMTGTEERPAQKGWINVDIFHDFGERGGEASNAFIGANPGKITLGIPAPNFRFCFEKRLCMKSGTQWGFGIRIGRVTSTRIRGATR